MKGDFTWDLQKGMKCVEVLHLCGIDLKVKKGEFVCIIGDVGCGKSSLLQAMIGEMIYIPPEHTSKTLDTDTINNILREPLPSAPIK